MTLRVRLEEGEPLELRLDRFDGGYRFSLGDAEECTASVEAVEPGIYSVLVDGRSYEVKIVPGQDNWYVDVRGQHIAVEIADPRDASTKTDGVPANGPCKVAAQMPGKVVRVLVVQGDLVEAGQSLVVVEAMKMQNELKAPKSGRVVAMLAREGASVAPGEVLAAIE
jgi:biotin carboxyl carrier protein